MQLVLNDTLIYEGPGSIDTGSESNLFPLSLLPESQKPLLTPTRHTVHGVSGKSMQAVGEFNCDVKTGYGTLNNVTFFVFDAKFPVLLGMSMLEHPDVEKFVLTNKSLQLQPSGSEPISISLASPALQATDENMIKKLEYLKSELKIELPVAHPNKAELNAVVSLLDKYKDVFGYEKSKIGIFPDPVAIPTVRDAVGYARQHPLPQKYRDGIAAEIKNMLENGIIELCKEPKGWNSPILAVSKPNGSIRLCCNFKPTLNKVLAPSADKFELPHTDVIFQEIGIGNQYFASLDLKSGYWHLKIREEDRHKTAFQYENKTYQFTRLPFGLKNAGDLFCRAASRALATVRNKKSFKSYVDDICVHARNFETYIETLEQIFETCRKFNMLLNPAKCKLLRSEATFLGRCINSEGYRPIKEYTDALESLPAPNTLKQLQKLIGRLTWLRNFIHANIGEEVAEKCCSNVLARMHELNRKGQKMVWTEEAEDAFTEAKKMLSSTEIISFADFAHPFYLVTDASDVAIGAVLLQMLSGKVRIVATSSKTLNSTQRNWSTTEREAYSILYHVEHWQYFLRGRPFIVQTDHKCLTFLDRNIFSNRKLARWQEKLSEYDFVVEYLPGEKNNFADMLSRPFNPQAPDTPQKSKVAGKFYKVANTPIRLYVPSWVDERLPEKMKLCPLDADIEGYSLLATLTGMTHNRNISELENFLP